MTSDNSHSFSEDEVNKMLAQQHEKHIKHLEDKLQQQSIEHDLKDIGKSVKHIDEKVCSYIAKTEENNNDLLIAIENVGSERRQCEKDIQEKIDKKVKERDTLITNLNNHVKDNYVTNKSLNKMVAIIVTTVIFTFSVSTYLGQSQSMKPEQIKSMIKVVIEEMKKNP